MTSAVMTTLCRVTLGAQRWTYYRLRAEGHNTLVINPSSGNDQTVGAKPPVILYTSEPNAERSAVVADLTSAYGVSKVLRGVQLFHNRRWAMVQDEIQAAAPANVWWFMHINSSTIATVDTNGTSVMLTQGTDRLWVTLLSGGAAFAISNAVPLPTSPNPSGQNANTGIRKLALHFTNVTSTTLAVMMVPLIPGANPPTNLPALIPLSDWGAGSTNVVTVLTNSAPSAGSANVMTEQGASVDVDLRTIATDAQTGSNDLLFAVSSALHGTATLLPDGHTVRFVPTPGYLGSASFGYTVRDTWPDPQLVSLYDFEPPETVSGGFVADRSGHGFYGMLTTVGTGTNNLVADSPFALGPHSVQSLLLRESGDFNGSRLSAPIAPADLDFDFHDWTFTGWFKRATSTNDDFVCYLGSSDGFGSPDEFQLYCPSGADTLALRHYVATTTTDLALSAANVRTGEWHHAAVAFHSTNGNGGVITLYLDGVLVGTDPTVTLNMASGFSCIFGGHGSSDLCCYPVV